MEIYSFQYIGHKATQEDFIKISEDKKLFVVCDGVGGMARGEKASAFIANTIVDYYNNNEAIFDLSLCVKRSCQDLSMAYPDEEIATTLVVAYLDGQLLQYTHVGDSRVYIHQNNSNTLHATKDHSLVQELFDAGILDSEDEMRQHPYRNRITRAIRSQKKEEDDCMVDLLSYRWQKNDIVLLCSDGVIENLTKDALKQVLGASEKTLFEKFQYIKALSEEKSIDNSSAIIFQF